MFFLHDSIHQDQQKGGWKALDGSYVPMPGESTALSPEPLPLQEYRHTLFEKGWFAVKGNAFIDLAGIQPVNTSFNTLFSRKNQYQYSGLGLRLIHKYIY